MAAVRNLSKAVHPPAFRMTVQFRYYSEGLRRWRGKFLDLVKITRPNIYPVWCMMLTSTEMTKGGELKPLCKRLPESVAQCCFSSTSGVVLPKLTRSRYDSLSSVSLSVARIKSYMWLPKSAIIWAACVPFLWTLLTRRIAKPSLAPYAYQIEWSVPYVSSYQKQVQFCPIKKVVIGSSKPSQEVVELGAVKNCVGALSKVAHPQRGSTLSTVSSASSKFLCRACVLGLSDLT